MAKTLLLWIEQKPSYVSWVAKEHLELRVMKGVRSSFVDLVLSYKLVQLQPLETFFLFSTLREAQHCVFPSSHYSKLGSWMR